MNSPVPSAADAPLDEDALGDEASEDAEAAYDDELLLLPLLKDESELAGELSMLKSVSSDVVCPPEEVAGLLAGRLKSGADMLSPLENCVGPDATAASMPPASPSALLHRR